MVRNTGFFPKRRKSIMRWNGRPFWPTVRYSYSKKGGLRRSQPDILREQPRRAKSERASKTVADANRNGGDARRAAPAGQQREAGAANGGNVVAGTAGEGIRRVSVQSGEARPSYADIDGRGPDMADANSAGREKLHTADQPAGPGQPPRCAAPGNVDYPCAADAEGTTGGGNHRSLRTDVGGQLNPDWVEWMMGYPVGWTDTGRTRPQESHE